jgi:FdrA protein
METYTVVKKNTYQDSMKLMQLQTALNEIPGVMGSAVAMGTPENKSQFQAAGLFTEDIQAASNRDLCIVVKAESSEGLSVVKEKIEKHFSPRIAEGYSTWDIQHLPKSISSAIKRIPEANLAFVSVPGQYAAMEAMEALNNGLNVFLFSDNVSIQSEIELKQLAEQKGLLVMGPDCGTAILSGVPLGLSNTIRKGKIGIIAASGSGMQEVCSLVHRRGEGVSQAVGTGGRDLSKEVGGITFARALRSLLNDDGTEVILLMSKHCDEQVVNRMLELVRNSGKPIVTYFPSLNMVESMSVENIYKARDFEHAAALCVALIQKCSLPSPLKKEIVLKEMGKVIQKESEKFTQKQRYVRAFMTGGSFAEQAMVIFSTFFDQVYAYPSYGKTLNIENPLHSMGHCIIDFGDDFFTKGKMHPIIDLSSRMERLKQEGKDETLKVILMDIVLGYGAHADPAGVLSRGIVETKRVFVERGGYLSVIVHLCGTDKDTQNYHEQKNKLEDCGVIVTDSSTRGALLACLIGTSTTTG